MRLTPFVAISLCALFWSCAKGSPSGSGDQIGDLAVAETIPAPGARDVEVDGEISVTFFEDLDPATVNEATFLLLLGEIHIPAEVRYETGSRRIHLKPSKSLFSATSYRAQVTTRIRKVSGEPVKEYSWQFTTRDIIAPIVKSYRPSAGSVIAREDEPPWVEFSESMDSSSLQSGNFLLTGPDGPVKGTIFFEEASRKAFFLPEQPLAVVTDYTALLSGEAADRAGNPLGSHLVWNFRTRTPLAGSRESLENLTAQTDDPPVAAGPFRNALAIWRQVDTKGNSFSIFSSMYDPVSGEWEDPVTLENFPRPAQNPDVVMDRFGNAMVAWQQNIPEPVGDGNPTVYMKVRFSGSADFEPFLRAEKGSGPAGQPSVSADGNGFFYVTFRQEVEEKLRAYINRYDVLTDSLKGRKRLSTDEKAEVFLPRIASSPDGESIVVWIQPVSKANGGDGKNSLWSRKVYPDFSLNGEDRLVEAMAGGDSSGHAVVADAQGNFLCAWLQDHGGVKSVYANRLPGGEEWDPEEVVALESSPGGAERVSAAFFDRGDALVVWDQAVLLPDGTERRDGFAAFYSVDQDAWMEPVRLNQDTSGDTLQPRLAILGDRAIVTFRQKRKLPAPGATDTINLYGREFDRRTGIWGPSHVVLIEDVTGAVKKHALGARSDGHAFSVFLESVEGFTNIHASRFALPIDIPQFPSQEASEH